MSQGIESLLKRISQLVLRRWEVHLSFLSDQEANEKYKFPFESTFSSESILSIKQPIEVSLLPIYRHNLLLGAVQIPTENLTHDDILEIVELTNSIIKQSLSLKEELHGAERTLNQLELENERVYFYGTLITRNKDLYKTWQALDEQLDSMTPILLCGEKGVGKHTLVHTYMEKNNLDDIEILILPISDSLSTKNQEEISSFLYQQKVDPTKYPRIIAISDYDYKNLSKQTWLKPTLLKRLSQVVITIKPLRKRLEDLILLMEHRFKASSNTKLSIMNCTPQTISALCEYNWPGNVKELFDAVDSLIKNCKQNMITADLLPVSIIGKGKIEALKKAKETNRLEDAITVLEKELIRECLKSTNWNKSLVSKQLGISRSGLINKVEKYNITH